ncbi:hypothetical protein VZT92_001668 [Zoarces viviparus]|uniref:Uncharacterized protein n=1 Tax=Zoarces viviparus TaxID=48416 RepID=A0AAW1G455_ZOAVI
MCDGRDSEQRTASNTDPEEEEECTCVTEDSKRTWTTPSLQELEEVLHSAPRSCRHGGEVWPNLYLGGPAGALAAGHHSCAERSAWKAVL